MAVFGTCARKGGRNAVELNAVEVDPVEVNAVEQKKNQHFHSVFFMLTNIKKTKSGSVDIKRRKKNRQYLRNAVEQISDLDPVDLDPVEPIF